MLQVVHAPAPVAAAQALQGDCCQPAPIPSPPSEAVVKKEQKIREVHISAALMEEFLRFVHLWYYGCIAHMLLMSDDLVS